jgi:lysozyme
MRRLILVIVLSLLVMALVVPAVSAHEPQSNGYWYTVHYGDTLSRIAHRHGVSMRAIIQANGLHNPDRIYSGQKLWIPVRQQHRIHVVQYGQTLSSIARSYGLSPWAIAEANGITNLDRIYAGQRLTLPW